MALGVVVVFAAAWLVTLASLALDVTGVWRRGAHFRWQGAGLLLMFSVMLTWQAALLRGWPVSRLHTLKTMTLPVGLAGLAIAAGLVIAALLSACGSDRENDRRLRVLQHDQFLRCRVDGAKPWTVLDTVGTTHGIGFGGTSPTLVLRDLRLTGNVDRVTAQLSACAAQAGWSVHPFSTGIAGFWARKRFEDRWNATLNVYVGDQIFRQQPAVEIRIQTDPV